jgi:enoyl-CoA hydratase/carnithine racemase
MFQAIFVSGAGAARAAIYCDNQVPYCTEARYARGGRGEERVLGTAFDDYAERYAHVAMRRSDGILEMRLHSEGGPLVWGRSAHRELGRCFADVGADRENRVVILTGTGEHFCARTDDSFAGEFDAALWDELFHDAQRLLMNLVGIEVPVITAVQGRAAVHAELGILGDIVLASEDAVFQDAAHFRYGTVPGDGVHAIWSRVIGPVRAQYFLLTAQKLGAEDGLRLGFVNEVLPRDALLERAHALARELARQPLFTLRYTRALFTRPLKRRLQDDLAFGLAVEGLGGHAHWPGGGASRSQA